MPNYILAIFDKTGPAPNIVYNTAPGFAYLQEADIVDGKVDFARVGQRYGLGSPKTTFTFFGFNKDGTPNQDYFPWKEINFSSPNPRVTGSLVQVTGQRLDSYTIQAIRNRMVPAVDNNIENAIQGILVKEGKFLLGGRGGTDQAGTLQPVPGGSVGWKEKYIFDPFTDAFHAEAEEEAGAIGITNVKLYGIFNQVTKHINRQWLFRGEPQQPIDKLVENIHKGIEFYRQQLAQGKNGREAKQALRESSFPVDAWENSDAWSFNYDSETLLRLLSDGQWLNPKGISMKLIGSLPADLYIAGAVDFGPEFKREADKSEFVKKDVVDQTKQY